MSDQLAIDFNRPSGRDLAKEGMERAADHAERDAPGWRDQALEYVRQYATEHYEFMCEAARRYAEGRGIGPPPDKRAWGAVMVKAARAGYVQKIGFACATDPKVHMNPAGLWRSRIGSIR